MLPHQVESAYVCGPVAHPELEAEPAFVEDLVMLTAPDVRSLEDLCARGEVRVVVLRVGCSYRLRLERILARRGISAPRVPCSLTVIMMPSDLNAQPAQGFTT